MKDDTLSQVLENRNVAHPLLGSAELKYASKVLMPDETIEHVLTGWYSSGPAIMMATDKRLLLIDKTPGVLIVEDFPYDVISEVDCMIGAFKAKVKICSKSQTISFSSFRLTQAQEFAQLVERKMYELREPPVERFIEQPTGSGIIWQR